MSSNLVVTKFFSKFSTLACLIKFLKGTIIFLWVLHKAKQYSGVYSDYRCTNKQQLIQKPGTIKISFGRTFLEA